METLTIHLQDDRQSKALKAVMKALGIPFEKTKKKDAAKKEKPYNPEFVAKIKERERQYAEGKYTIIKTEDLWKQPIRTRLKKIFSSGNLPAIGKFRVG